MGKGKKKKELFVGKYGKFYFSSLLLKGETIKKSASS
jgi:hypothetical protein